MRGLPLRGMGVARGHDRRSNVRVIASLLALAFLAPLVLAQTSNDRAAREVEAQQRLDVVREDIAKLTGTLVTLDSERGEAVRALREADRSVDREGRALQEIQTQVAAQEVELARLEVEREVLERRLDRQRKALAGLLRSAYALGQHEQLKLLLAQDRIDALARVLAYHRYFERDRITRIEALLGELQQLADVVRKVREQRLLLAQSQALQQERIGALEAQREERRVLVADLDARFRDADTRLKALARDEQALTQLLEKLHDIFADIPEQLDAAQPFSRRQGKLTRPVAGSTLVAFAGKLPDGRTSQGWLIAAEAGIPVRAVAHGRVAFSDWLNGYGLIVILDHGDGYMSLYAQNDSLHREVGDWVDAGDAIASVGSSGGQLRPALYFELRRGGRPVDPKNWFGTR